MDWPTDISSYKDAILHFCDVLGLSDNKKEKQEETPSFFDFENNWLPTDGRTDGRTDQPTDGPTDGPTNQPTDGQTIL